MYLDNINMKSVNVINLLKRMQKMSVRNTSLEKDVTDMLPLEACKLCTQIIWKLQWCVW